MKKLLVSLLLVLFPVALFAADAGSSSLSFTPSIGDVSVVFLSNIFGVVDGVLHGSGSQIMGAMFAVFNSAVLALGGIIIMYTLMVSTVNTAHEGQMLGQKWSSIWVPVRSTLGLTLLIPKATGYCLMQIIFMWVIVQGVGAADKVWEAALAYLNRGGVIVQAQLNPIAMFMGQGQAVSAGAANILYGQACMLGIENVLKAQRNSFLNDKLETCKNAQKGDSIKTLCDTPVPDFLASVNAIEFQQKRDDELQVAATQAKMKQAQARGVNQIMSALGNTGTIAVKNIQPYVEPMPDFKSDSPYYFLSGICGKITWNPIGSGFSDTAVQHAQTVVGGESFNTVNKTRATAVQQMYLDLADVAQSMVRNNPQLKTNTATNTTTGTQGQTATEKPTAPWADEPYGFPLTDSGEICQTAKLGQPGSCTDWGTPGSQTALFNGTEFQGAVSDYTAIMLPTLTLFTTEPEKGAKTRDFLNQAQKTGWMLAGSYFFKLSTLSAANARSYQASGGQTTAVYDKNSGLGGSSDTAFNPAFLRDVFAMNDSGASACKGIYATLCQWLNKDGTRLRPVLYMILSPVDMTPFDIPLNNTNASNPEIKVVSDIQKASTAYGFVQNSLMMTLPGQAGTMAPAFNLDLAPNFTVKGYSLPTTSIECSGFMCIPSAVAEIFYNYIIRYLLQTLITAVMTIMNTVLMTFLALPLLGMGEIFKAAVEAIRNPNANPIVALANMGINFINFASDMWIFLLLAAISPILIPIVGMFILAMLMMALPLLIAWLGVMLTIGYLTAYYIPFVPYMIFTFASIAWLMAVVEAMVAAPIVALSITHPEGEGPFGGKAEQSLMILMNVFLRPSLMIIGYISGIILSYVAVWVINAGFSNVLPFMQGESSWSAPSAGTNKGWEAPGYNTTSSGSINSLQNTKPTYTPPPPSEAAIANYTGWAGIYGFFFAIIIYTSMYLTVVQKSFSLIGILPDKVLRWIGVQPEQIGQEAVQWTEETKKQMEGAGKATEKAAGQIGSEAKGKITEGVKGIKEKFAPTKGSMGESK